MILPDLVLPSRVNQQWQYSGIDSPEHCRDRRHFENYTLPVSYCYNSRGFRDHEWPDSLQQLKKSIWCVGDSFTVGLGSPWQHIWPVILHSKTSARTINVSMDGASNNWISRKAIRILQEIKPDCMVIHWSYVSRREATVESVSERFWNSFYSAIRAPGWPDCAWTDIDSLPQFIKDEIETVHGGFPVLSDESRILQSIKCSTEQDIENTLHCIQQVDQHADSTKIVHSFIPEFVPAQCRGQIESQLSGLVIPELSRLDLARDGHHYDIKTSEFFCRHIVDFLNC